MRWKNAFLALAVPRVHALIRFGCSQLVVQRLDPLVQPGSNPSAHLHQIVGGDTFAASMDPAINISAKATCTTCQFSEDFSNYWTAVLYFRARNGTYKRVPQVGNVGFEGQRGGMTVYYMQDFLGDYQQRSRVTAFKQGFRMLVGDVSFRSRDQLTARYRHLSYTCLQTPNTRFPETPDFPKQPCPAGIMVSVNFPTCWDGKNLDSPDHQSHMSYPESGTFESGGPCPASHPVRVPQVLFEVVWDTHKFNSPDLWPEDGSQPFVWSSGDKTGYSNHGDYLFGWKNDALQRVMDKACYVNCYDVLKTQSISEMNQCAQQPVVHEEIDGWLDSLPGGNPVS